MSAVVAIAAPIPSPEDREWLERATDLSRSAGPDGAESHFVSDSCGLGHALLRTGPTEGPQPLALDARIWLSGDVRLDARVELVSALRSHGADVSRSTSDAELVLNAYGAWGERFLDRVAGDFAIVLWDERAQRLLCARDQLGVTPLHYARIGDRLLVATAVDALLLHPAVSDALDESAIADFLTFGHYTDFAATAFAAIRQLPPAHLLTWSANGGDIRRYWQIQGTERLARFATFEEGAERFLCMLDDAVVDRMTSDRATAQLSGGMDSSSVAASAVAAMRARGAPAGALRGLTGVLGGDSGDREGDFASLVADKLGMPVDVLDAWTMPPVDPFAEPALLTPEPTAYRFTNFEHQYARVPARHAPVALSGHCGDALLMFVPWYWLEWIAQGRVARLARAFADQVRLTGGRPRPHARSIMRAAWAGRNRTACETPSWLTPDLLARTAVTDRIRLRESSLSLPPVRALDARSLADDPLWAALFRLGDPAFTREPVRFRYPFADLRLMQFVLSLAPEPWLFQKRVLRNAVRERLPDEVIRRPKTPIVATAPSGATDDTRRGLMDLVRRCGELEQFLDADVLAGTVASSAASADQRRWRELGLALGLAHWLWHRRTTGSGLGVAA